MKIRTGFVSNSSSSSFVCEICGRSEAGYDMGIEEAEMYECVNGHTFCISEAVEDITGYNSEATVEEKIAIILEYHKKDLIYFKIKSGEISEEEIESYYEQIMEDLESEDMYEVDEKYCPICQMLEMSNNDVYLYLENKTKITRAEAFAAIKNENRRRKKLYDNEYIRYVCDKIGKSSDEVADEIREKFSTYKEFAKSIKR